MSMQVHDMDTFWCMVALLIIACAMNVQRGKSYDVLNREQTEEWKGWMQFIFLLYSTSLPTRPTTQCAS